MTYWCDTNQETEDPFGTPPQSSIFVGIGIYPIHRFTFFTFKNSVLFGEDRLKV